MLPSFGSLKIQSLSCLLLLSTLVCAQQFEAYPIPYEYPTISVACKAALNTNVQCHPILPAAAMEIPRLSLRNLTNVCVPSCLTSLQSARQKIVQSCTSTDIITAFDKNYPATYIVDNLIYAFGIMCRRDPETQKFCDVLIMEWINNGQKSKTCTHCMLSAGQLRLNSPFGYGKLAASRFASITSSCSKTGYAVTSPPPYALSTSTVSSGASEPTYPSSCITLYTTQNGDTCNSIALAKNVSSFAVYGANGVDCKNISAGKRLCLFGQCQKYKVKRGDTCDGIITANKISVDAEEFTAWNPNIYPECDNINNLVDEYICLSQPDGLTMPELSENYASQTLLTWPTRPTQAVTKLPTAPGTKAGCLEFRNYKEISEITDPYYGPVSGPTDSIVNECYYVSQYHGIMIEELLQWNPSLKNEGNCIFAAGFSYCVDHPERLSSSSFSSSTATVSSTRSGSGSGSIASSTTRTSLGVSTSSATTTRITTLLPTTTPVVPTTTRTTTPIPTPTPAPGQVCIRGTGDGNHAGLCDYTCHYGYCPTPVCQCLVFGAQVPSPQVNSPIGYPAPGLDDSYLGLCAYTCARGYCPAGACVYR